MVHSGDIRPLGHPPKNAIAQNLHGETLLGGAYQLEGLKPPESTIHLVVLDNNAN
jgi:hypothetical protein